MASCLKGMPTIGIYWRHPLFNWTMIMGGTVIAHELPHEMLLRPTPQIGIRVSNSLWLWRVSYRTGFRPTWPGVRREKLSTQKGRELCFGCGLPRRMPACHHQNDGRHFLARGSWTKRTHLLRLHPGRIMVHISNHRCVSLLTLQRVLRRKNKKCHRYWEEHTQTMLFRCSR